VLAPVGKQDIRVALAGERGEGVVFAFKGVGGPPKPRDARYAAVVPFRAARPGLNGREFSVWSDAHARRPEACCMASPKAMPNRGTLRRKRWPAAAAAPNAPQIALGWKPRLYRATGFKA